MLSVAHETDGRFQGLREDVVDGLLRWRRPCSWEHCWSPSHSAPLTGRAALEYSTDSVRSPMTMPAAAVAGLL